MTAAATAKRAITEGLRLAIPDGSLSVSKWAAEYRVVDRGARPGKWSNETVPFLTEIMDCVTEPDVREVVFQKSVQVGGSELLNNIAGYYIHIDPTQIMYVGEIEDKAKAWTQESFDTMVAKTDVLKRLIKTADEDNNQRIKRFPGGQLTIIWASSPAGASSRPVQVVLFDEVDKYKPTKEGNIIKIAEGRTTTYSGSEKIVKVSSPLDADTSEIEKAYLKGDQREYYVPCPSCDEFQTLKWANVKWDDEDPATTYMVCMECGIQIDYDDLHDMLLKGVWRAGQAFNGVASFKISQLYSPFVPWERMVADFLEAKKFKSTLREWVNLCLGETWKPEERIDYADLQLHREDYAHVVPNGVLCLTAAVDVQVDRLEVEIVGWGHNHESWSIGYHVLNGDPGQNEVWDELADLLTANFEGENRTFRVNLALVDSGYHTTAVYKFTHQNAKRKWFACKGMSDPFKPLISKHSWAGKNPKVRLYPIGTNAAKDEIFAFLQVDEPGPGFCHFPDRPEYDESHLKQLCSEKKITRARLGKTYRIYEKVGPSVRNEALDLRVYNTAARAILNPNYEAIERRRLVHSEVADREPVEGERERGGEGETKPDAMPAAVLPFRGGSLTKNNPFEGYKP